MLRQILGVGDLLTAFLIPLGAFVFSPSIVVVGAKWLIIKGGIFALGGDYVSIIDILVGLYLLMFALGWSLSIVSVIVFLWLLQKSVASFL